MRHSPVDRLQQAVDDLTALESRAPDHGGDVHLDMTGPIAWLLLDHERAHNALTVRMMRQLAEHVQSLQRWDGAIVGVASARGGSFCAGGHLGQVRDTLVHDEAARIMTRSMEASLDALLALPALSVAVVEGPAIGGGVELASACDLRVATPAAWFLAAQVRLGVACGWGGARRLVTHLGRRQALRLLTRSERVPAEEAVGIGLVDAIADGDRDALLAAVLGPTLEHPAASVRAAKRQVQGEDAAEAFLSVWGGPAHREALGE